MKIIYLSVNNYLHNKSIYNVELPDRGRNDPPKRSVVELNLCPPPQSYKYIQIANGYFLKFSFVELVQCPSIVFPLKTH